MFQHQQSSNLLLTQKKITDPSLEAVDDFDEFGSDQDAMIDVDGEDLDQQLNELETLIH